MRELFKTIFWKSQCDQLPLLRNSTQAAKDWLIEYALSRFVGSACVDYVIQHSQYILVSSLLLQLRNLEDFFGLLRVAIPVFFFLLVCSSRRLLHWLEKLYMRTRAKLK